MGPLLLPDLCNKLKEGTISPHPEVYTSVLSASVRISSGPAAFFVFFSCFMFQWGSSVQKFL